MGELRRVEQALRLQPGYELLLLVPGHGQDASGYRESPLSSRVQPENQVVITLLLGYFPCFGTSFFSQCECTVCRRSFEYAKERHLIDFPVTSEYDQTRYDALQTKLKTLDNAIINLDKTVMLLDKL